MLQLNAQSFDDRYNRQVERIKKGFQYESPINSSFYILLFQIRLKEVLHFHH